MASRCSARRGHLYLEPPKNWASQLRHDRCASPISLEAVRNSSPPDRSSWSRRPLDPLVLAPLGDTKLRHVRKQTQLHPHEGSLLCRGGSIQVRRGGPIPHPTGRDHPPGPCHHMATTTLCSAPLLSSAGSAPCTACCTPTRRGAPPTWCTRETRVPTSSRVSPVSDGRAGPRVCVCGRAGPPAGRCCCGIAQCVCTEGCCAAPCPLPCLPGREPPLPAPGRWARTGPEHLTLGHGGAASPGSSPPPAGQPRAMRGERQPVLCSSASPWLAFLSFLPDVKVFLCFSVCASPPSALTPPCSRRPLTCPHPFSQPPNLSIEALAPRRQSFCIF